MAGLSNISIDSFYLEDADIALAAHPESDAVPKIPLGTLLVANISIWNPSVATMELGDVSFDMIDDQSGQQLGTASTLGLRLRPGANFVTLKGILLPTQSKAGLAAAGSFFSNFLQVFL